MKNAKENEKVVKSMIINPIMENRTNNTVVQTSKKS